jgi:hypothetical protein
MHLLFGAPAVLSDWWPAAGPLDLLSDSGTNSKVIVRISMVNL